MYSLFYYYIFQFTVATRKRKDICGIAKPVSEISLSSNESAKETTEYTKPITNLQSPIESHFAVTPTTDSKASSPANGFTSIESGKLLCEELDNLNIDTHLSKESIVSDDFVPIHSSTSFDDLKDRHSISKESVHDELAPIHSSTTNTKAKSEERLCGGYSQKEKIDMSLDEFSDASERDIEKQFSEKKKDRRCESQLSDLFSPAEESISMFTQLSDKLTEITNEADSGVDTAHNYSDDETCKPEVRLKDFICKPL